MLAAGSQIFYVDHHYPGKVLRAHPNFQALIDTSTMVCTSLLIDSYVHRRFHNWAIVAAFGDNLNIVAKDLACKAGLFDQKTQALKELGVCINYNSYGASVDDLHFHPAYLFRELVQYKDPLDFISANVPIYNKLRSGYQEDLARGLAADKVSDTPSSLVIGLPDEPWARRVSGVLGNELTNTNPDRACAVVTACPNATFLVSIRAPLNNRTGADEVARQFPSGGGRKGAAGINALPVHQLDEFIQLMSKYWSK